VTALLVAAVAAPAVMTLALAAPRLRRAVRSLAPLAALPGLCLALFGETGSAVELPWLLKHTLFVLDDTARVFLGFTSALYLVASWYARADLRRDAHPDRFFAALLSAMAGNFALILAGDVPTFFVGFAVMGLTSAVLVLHRGDAEARRAGRVYLALTMASEVLIFTGLVFLIVNAGTTQIALLHRGPPDDTASLLLLLGFGIKAGALALHFWLPLAHPAAPVPASAVLSGAMIKAGLLGWIRFLPLGAVAAPTGGYALIAAGLGAALLGTIVGVAQRNPKTVLAYSSVSQMGIITTGLGIGALWPPAWPQILSAVLIYATHHAVSKGALFLGVGTAKEARSPRQRFVVRVGLLLPALALAGAPFSSGAVAKLALKSNLAFLPDGLAAALGILLPLAAVGTTLKMARFLWLTWPHRPLDDAADRDAGRSGIWLPWLLLVAAVPAAVWLLPGALVLLPTKLTLEKLWLTSWPLLLGGSLAALGAWLRPRLAARAERWLPAGDVGVLVERLVAALSGRRRREAAPPRPKREPSAGLSRLHPALGAVETGFRSWPISGLLLLGVLALLFLLM
jgi:hydrogenase-4 component B